MTDEQEAELRYEAGMYQSLYENAKARIEALETALHEAFMAMCAYRDNKDEEVFQDAIDALGLAAFAPEQDK